MEIRVTRCEECEKRHKIFGFEPFCPMIHITNDGKIIEFNNDNDFCSKGQRKALGKNLEDIR